MSSQAGRDKLSDISHINKCCDDMCQVIMDYFNPDVKKPTLHYVKIGDNLGGLAKKYGVSSSAIKEANGMTDNNIDIGQLLKIPPKVEK